LSESYEVFQFYYCKTTYFALSVSVIYNISLKAITPIFCCRPNYVVFTELQQNKI